MAKSAAQSSLILSILIHQSKAACPTGPVSSFTGTCDLASFEANLVSGCTLADLGLDSAAVADLCKYEAPVQFVEINGYYQLDKRYFNGGGPLIDSAEPFDIEAGRILRFEENFGDNTLISWPEYEATLGYNNNEHGYSPNFDLQDSCNLNTVMCCYIDDVHGSGFQEGDSTTDVCRHDLANSRKANHINEGWSIFPNTETDTHCVGFSWNEGEVSDVFKGNALYDVSLRTTVNKGYYKSIPGAPLCGCIEQMPVVETADCRTATGGEITYTFSFDAETGKVTGSNSVDITYADCEEDDLASHFKAKNPDNADAIDEHFAYDCADDLTDYLNDKQFLVERPHATKYISIPEESGWKQVAGEGIRFLPPNYSKDKADEDFRALIKAGCTNSDGSVRDCIIRRFCDSCSYDSHRDIYYKRITPIPDAGSDEGQVYFLDLFLNNWFNSPANELGTDFELYSSYEDALAGTNKWQFCNYNDPGIGFPRDCSDTTSAKLNQWNSFIRGGGTANQHGFFVELPHLSGTVQSPTTARPTNAPVSSAPVMSIPGTVVIGDGGGIVVGTGGGVVVGTSGGVVVGTSTETTTETTEGPVTTTSTENAETTAASENSTGGGIVIGTGDGVVVSGGGVTGGSIVIGAEDSS